MNDPYAVLGVNPSASDEEIKKAYRELVKKYHPDHYANNPLADLAEAKMKEVNEAYDAIVKMRTQGGYQSTGGSRSSYQNAGQQSQYKDPILVQARQYIAQNNLGQAEQLLQNAATRSAEWYYLMGSIAFRKGWMDDARQNFWTACNMEPGNLEYRQALNSLGVQANRGSYGGGMDLTSLCAAMCCADMMCDCC